MCPCMSSRQLPTTRASHRLLPCRELPAVRSLFEAHAATPFSPSGSPAGHPSLPLAAAPSPPLHLVGQQERAAQAGAAALRLVQSTPVPHEAAAQLLAELAPEARFASSRDQATLRQQQAADPPRACLGRHSSHLEHSRGQAREEVARHRQHPQQAPVVVVEVPRQAGRAPSLHRCCCRRGHCPMHPRWLPCDQASLAALINPRLPPTTAHLQAGFGSILRGVARELQSAASEPLPCPVGNTESSLRAVSRGGAAACLFKRCHARRHAAQLLLFSHRANPAPATAAGDAGREAGPQLPHLGCLPGVTRHAAGAS